MDAIYFGCNNDRVGHRAYDKNMTSTYLRVDSKLQWVQMADGLLAPRDSTKQGIAVFHFIHGYSIISFWDRSINKRGGSSSTFFIKGEFTFEETLEGAKNIFPSIFERFEFEIKRDKN